MKDSGAVEQKQRKVKLHKTQKDLSANEQLYVYSQVMALHVLGHHDADIAERLGLSQVTVKNFRNRTSPELEEALRLSKTNLISELVEKGLEANLRAMIEITGVTKDDVWLKAQRAPELATFFGVISDKTARVFAAIERANERDRLERERQAWETNTEQQQTIGA